MVVICIDVSDTTVKQINSILFEYYQISQYITVGSVEKEFDTQSNWCYPINNEKSDNEEAEWQGMNSFKQMKMNATLKMH